MVSLTKLYKYSSRCSSFFLSFYVQLAFTKDILGSSHPHGSSRNSTTNRSSAQYENYPFLLSQLSDWLPLVHLGLMWGGRVWVHASLAGMFIFELMIVFHHTELFDRLQHFLASVYLFKFLKDFVWAIRAALRGSRGGNSTIPHQAKTQRCTPHIQKCSCLTGLIREGKLSDGKSRSTSEYIVVSEEFNLIKQIHF